VIVVEADLHIGLPAWMFNEPDVGFYELPGLRRRMPLLVGAMRVSVVVIVIVLMRV
jgi:hypothetical protein